MINHGNGLFQASIPSNVRNFPDVVNFFSGLSFSALDILFIRVMLNITGYYTCNMRKNAEKKTSSDVPRGRVTIRMVADRAGVSSAAVYAALNRNPRSNIGISEEKRKTIQKVIAELGYIPNNSARMLVSGRSSNIGVLLNTIDVQFSRMLGRAISERCMQHGFMAFVEYYNFDPALERRKLEMFFSRGIDALVAIASGDFNRDLFEGFSANGIPLVFCGHNALSIANSRYVGVSETDIANTLGEFITRNGVRRTAYLSYVGWSNPIGVRAFQIAEMLKQKNVALAAHCESAGFPDVAAFIRQIFEMPESERPQLLVAFTDELGSIAVNAILSSGHTLRELPVIGIDGQERPFDTVPLTSVYLPFEAIVDQIWKSVDAGMQRTPVVPADLHSSLLLRDSTPGMN